MIGNTPATYIKEDVQGDLTPNMTKCKGRLQRLYYSKGLDFIITSKREGKHQPGSMHPEGGAIDFKRQGVTKKEIRFVAGTGFDVIEYSDKKDIFHVEYDPH